jgi:glycosyltransferase involved in cell wall biosynthesis
MENKLNNMTILLCIPAFNEENVIGDLVKKSLKFVDHIVVCDDGSSDKTSEIAENAGAYVIKSSQNKGKGNALQLLFKYARHQDSEIIVTMDGDGQFKPDEIPKLCGPILNDDQDLVIGYRFDNNDEMPKYREIGNKMLDRLSNMALKLPLRDTQSGFRAYSKNAIQSITFSNEGFGADSEILINAYEKGLKITEEKVTVIYDTGYKTSTKNPISHTTGVVASLIELILIKHPLKFLGIPGILLIISGIFTSFYVLSIFNETRYFSIGFTMLGMGLFIFGLLLILVSGLLYSFNKQIKNN